jgi:hypothetical protein
VLFKYSLKQVCVLDGDECNLPFSLKFIHSADLPRSLYILRLILMSVNVAEGAAVAFDSYETEEGSRKSEYGKYITQDGKEALNRVALSLHLSNA